MAVCPNGHDSVTDDVCDVCGTSIARRVVGKHHAGGPRPAGSPEDTCPWCGNASSSQFCPRCGFRVRRPFAPLAVPATDSQPVVESSLTVESPLVVDVPLSSEPPSDLTSWSAVPATASPLDPLVPWDRPAFLDWFKSPDPELHQEPEPEPAPEPEPEPEPSASAPTAPIPKVTATTWSVVVTADRVYYDRMQAMQARMGWSLTFPDYISERRFLLTGKQMRIGRRSAARSLEPEIDLSAPPADPGISRLHALLIPAPDGTWAVLDPGSANGTLVNGREIAHGDLIPLRAGDRINLGAWTAITVHRE
jgi:hypothetical protein